MPNNQPPASASPDAPVTPDVADLPERPVNRGGAPRGNRNALKHGLRSEAIRRGLSIGSLPKELRTVENAIRHFRGELEAAVLLARSGHADPEALAAAVRGEPGLPEKLIPMGDSLSIQLAVKLHGQMLMAEKYLRDDYEQLKLKPADVMKLHKSITDAATARNREVAKLGLTQAPTSTAASLYGDDFDEPLPEDG